MNAIYYDFIKGAQERLHREEADDWLDDHDISNATAMRLRLGYYDPSTDTDLKEILDRIHEENGGECPITKPSIIVPFEGNDYFGTICIAPGSSLVQRGAQPQVGKGAVWSESDLWTSDGAPIILADDMAVALLLKSSGASVIYSRPFDLQGLSTILKGKAPSGPLVFLPDNKEELDMGLAKLQGLAEILGDNGLVAFAYDLENYPYNLEEYRGVEALAQERGLEGVQGLYKAVSVWTNRGSKALQELYAKSSGAGIMEAFRSYIYSKGPQDSIPTGLKALDDLLEGGLYNGLYILGAVSSLGKTTFALQIADQIAQSGRDVLFFTLEQSPFELMAKSISRLSKQYSEDYWDSLTANRILNKAYDWPATSKDSIEGKMALYEAEIGPRIHFIDSDNREEATDSRIGLDTIKASIVNHITITGRRPVVFIDYLQIMRTDDPRKSDKQAMDELVSGLRTISRDQGLPIFAISSYSRASYLSPASMSAFKESGAIEYSSDVLIGLQPEGLTTGEDKRGNNAKVYKSARESEIRDIELVVLKNRMGKTGTIPLTYYAMFNLYEEHPGPEEGSLQDKGVPIFRGKV